MREQIEPDANRGFFRCPVQVEDSAALISIRGKRFPVLLQDKSIDGFSVLVERRHSQRLRLGPQWILESNDERTEVLAQWMFNAPDGSIQIGLRRLRDLTMQPKPALFPTFRVRGKHQTQPDLAIAGIGIVIILALSLPGIGTRLGTAGWIQNGLVTLYDVVTASNQ